MYITKRLFLILIPIIFSACVRDNNDDCGIYLEFIFDYNMEYADSFNPQVNSVDVFVFDEEDKLVLHKYAESNELINRKQMYLTDDLAFGKYKIITIGGQSEHIQVRSSDGNNSAPGPSTIDRLMLALQRESSDVSFEFSHAWFGETVEINYDFNRAVWPVRLVRNTNKFNLMLQNIDAEDIPQPGVPPYTFEIVTPEAGVYDYNNEPLIKEDLSYHPFSLVMVDEPENTSVGRLNTMRLLTEDEPDSYRLVIRQVDTSERIWGCDLISLLKSTKPLTRPDGTELPMQEYLDRQGEWNIEILYREIIEEGRTGFVAVKIIVNGWILWLNEIGV